MTPEVITIIGTSAGFVGILSAIVWRIAKNGSAERARIYEYVNDQNKLMVSEKTCLARGHDVKNQFASIQKSIDKLDGKMDKLLIKNGIK